MRLALTLAHGTYDRTVPLLTGAVQPEGIELNIIDMAPNELFRRQGRHAEFDVSEYSLCTFSVLLARGDRRFVGIPIFPMRKFRHGDIYVNVHAGIREAKDLVGKRVGAGDYQQTAATWIRGILQHEYGVRPNQMEWYFGGFNAPIAFSHRVPINLPSDLRTHVISDHQSLDQMLDSGEIDAVVGATMPDSFQHDSPNVARLFPNYPDVEAEYYRKTGIFPIMHVLMVKRDVYEKAPWVAVNLYKAFVQAREIAERRLRYHGELFVMEPWLMYHLEHRDRVMGPDPFADGVQKNRKVLETFLMFCDEHGLLERPLTVDEMFPAELKDIADLGIS